MRALLAAIWLVELDHTLGQPYGLSTGSGSTQLLITSAPPSRDGLLTVWTGRLGPAIVTHVVFNGSVIGLLLIIPPELLQ